MARKYNPESKRPIGKDKLYTSMVYEASKKQRKNKTGVTFYEKETYNLLSEIYGINLVDDCEISKINSSRITI